MITSPVITNGMIEEGFKHSFASYLIIGRSLLVRVAFWDEILGFACRSVLCASPTLG